MYGIPERKTKVKNIYALVPFKGIYAVSLHKIVPPKTISQLNGNFFNSPKVRNFADGFSLGSSSSVCNTWLTTE